MDIRIGKWDVCTITLDRTVAEELALALAIALGGASDAAYGKGRGKGRAEGKTLGKTAGKADYMTAMYRASGLRGWRGPVRPGKTVTSVRAKPAPARKMAAPVPAKRSSKKLSKRARRKLSKGKRR